MSLINKILHYHYFLSHQYFIAFELTLCKYLLKTSLKRCATHEDLWEFEDTQEIGLKPRVRLLKTTKSFRAVFT